MTAEVLLEEHSAFAPPIEFVARDSNGAPLPVELRDRLPVGSGLAENGQDFALWEREMGFQLIGTQIMKPPKDLPEGMIATNPGAIIIEQDSEGRNRYLVPLRIEQNIPNQIGTTTILFCEIDPFDLTKAPEVYIPEENQGRTLQPDADDIRIADRLDDHQRAVWKAKIDSRFFPTGAVGVVGEDCAVSRVTRLDPATGQLKQMWQVSATYAWEDPDEPYGIGFGTRVWYVDSLRDLHPGRPADVHLPREKDIRSVADPTNGQPNEATGVLGTEENVYGRPSPQSDLGAISCARLVEPDQLSATTMANAQMISGHYHGFDRPVGQRVKGAVSGGVYLNLNVLTSPDKPAGSVIVLFGHEAQKTRPFVAEGEIAYGGLRYVTSLYTHAMHPAKGATGGQRPGALRRLSDNLVTIEDFPEVLVKTADIDLSQVVFSGDLWKSAQESAVPYAVDDNYEIHAVTAGVSDGAWGFAFIRCKRGLLSHGAQPVLS